jgi:hypothetical protein
MVAKTTTRPRDQSQEKTSWDGIQFERLGRLMVELLYIAILIVSMGSRRSQASINYGIGGWIYYFTQLMSTVVCIVHRV